jgi:hypothetical protein
MIKILKESITLDENDNPRSKSAIIIISKDGDIWYKYPVGNIPLETQDVLDYMNPIHDDLLYAAVEKNDSYDFLDFIISIRDYENLNSPNTKIKLDTTAELLLKLIDHQKRISEEIRRLSD